MTPIAGLAQSPPLEFKGMRIGQPMPESMRRTLGCRPVDDTCTQELWSVHQGRTIAGAAIERLAVGLDENRNVSTIALSVDASEFDIVRDALAAKYPALKCVQSTTQNLAGNTFDQMVCRYADSAGSLTITKRDAKVSMTTVVMISHAAMAKADAQRAERLKDL